MKETRVAARQRRHARVRRKISGTAAVPRLNVFRSLKHMYVQLIDDTAGKTLLTVSSTSKDLADAIGKAKNKTEIAKIVGEEAAKKAKDLKLEQVVFDRADYIYHGRVKAVAEAARKGGLVF